MRYGRLGNSGLTVSRPIISSVIIAARSNPSASPAVCPDRGSGGSGNLAVTMVKPGANVYERAEVA